MLIIFPVSHRDITLALPLAEHIKALGKAQGHTALVAYSTKAKATHSVQIAEFVKALEESFDAVDSHEVLGNIEPDGFNSRSMLFPHIVGANGMFASTVSYLINNKPQDFYWFELDNVPLRQNWLVDLVEEYRQARRQRKDFLGHIKNYNSYVKLIDGSVSMKETNNPFMVGTAIYPANIHQFTRLWISAQKVAWDIKCREEILPHAQHTNSIVHNWGTANYRVEGDKIVCDKTNPHSPALTSFDISLLDQCVLHGCKDGSLLKIVRDNLGEVKDVVQVAQTLKNKKK